MIINDFYKPKISNFKKGYKNFKIFHNTKPNIIFHFFTSLLQIIFNFIYILSIILIPYITDGIGHKLENNFAVVLLMTNLFKNTNSAGVNGFFNFLYRIMLFLEKFFKICF